MKVTALAGGVGGAKLADGLARALLADDRLDVIVNTGDDFVHYGLKICPDLDTVCYTLAGISNPQTGWGIDGDERNALEMIRALGGEDWFSLGDKDLGTHLERTKRLNCGETLSKVTGDFCKAWNIGARIYPMSDDVVSTYVDTIDYGVLSFQEYFVKYRCMPAVRTFEFRGSASAQPAPGVIESLNNADVIVICPSNPWVSIDPIFSIKEIFDVVRGHPCVIAVSPIVGGKTIKGPAAKMFTELGIEASAINVAAHYKGVINYLVIDTTDAEEATAIEKLGIIPYVTNTIMLSVADRQRLACEILHFIRNGQKGCA